MTPDLLTADRPPSGRDGSFKWSELKRLCGLLWPERRTLLIGTLLTIVFAGLNTGGLAGVFPLIKVLLEKEGLHAWVQRWAAGQRLGVEFGEPGDSGSVRVLRTHNGWEAGGSLLHEGDEITDGHGRSAQAILRELAVSSEGTEVLLRVAGTPPREVLVSMPPRSMENRAALWAVGLIPEQAVRGNITTLTYLLIALVVLMLAGNLFRYLGEVVIASAVLRAMMNLRARLYEKTLELPLAHHLAQPTSDLVTRFVQDIHEIQRGLLTLFGRCIREPLRVVLLLGLAFALDWRITLAMVIVSPIAVAVFWSIGRSVKRANRKLLQRLGAMLGAVTDSLQNIRVVKAYGAEEHERRRLTNVDQQMFRQQLRLAKLEAATGPLIESLAIVAGSVLAVWFASRVLAHEIPMAKFGTIGFLLAVLFDPLRKLSDVYVKVLRSTAGAERIFGIIDSPGERELTSGTTELGPLRDRIEYEDVTFHYPQAEVPALRRVNLTIRQGETLAVVGPNGSGKTTLLGLLLRFFDPQQGRILYDGVDLRKATLRSLRRQIGLVTQDAVIFAGTPIENIAYGDPAPDRERAIAAARRASADGFIRAIAGGYDAVLGERGTSLSGGQRQRIAIARAIYRDAPILIFDEATSQVDSESEQAIHRAIREFAVGRTTLIIAHRLSTIQYARRIVVMDEGRVLDTGTHRELFDRCPLYRTLCETQLVADDESGVAAVEVTSGRT